MGYTKITVERRERVLLMGLIRPGKLLASVNNTYTHFRVTLHAYECRLLKGAPKPLGCQNWRGASPTDLKKLPLSKIDRMVVRQAEDECNEG